jgi:hypothetical protein
MRVLSILARHGSTKYTGAIDDLQDFRRTRLPSAHHDLLVVDNALEGREAASAEGHEVIAGSNRCWEFSAWDEGLAHVGARIWDYDFVHLVTSAFRTLYTRYIDRFDEQMLGSVADRGAAVGHVDCYNQPIELLGNRSQCWLRSSFVFVPPAELVALGSLAGVRDPAPFFSGNPADPFLPDAPLCDVYRGYLLDWLTGPGTGQGTVWHSRFVLDRETLPFFQAKVLAILNEHMLSIRLRRQGCALVDATWLATHAERRRRAARPGPFPGWRDQLAERDTDAVRPPDAVASAR